MSNTLETTIEKAEAIFVGDMGIRKVIKDGIVLYERLSSYIYLEFNEGAEA